MNIFKKLSISFLLVLTVFTSFAPILSPVFAADDNAVWYNQSFSGWYSKVYDTTNPSEIFGERYTAAQVQWIFYSILSLPLITNPKIFTCIFSGDAGACLQAIIKTQGKAPETQSVAAQKKVPNLAQLIFADRPLSGITYTKNVFRKFHVIPEAQAQTTGFGFGALNPILNLWTGSRNITYVLLILVIIVMSFMIMFRVKISPQVVISVQSALPQVFLAIILITFSYAIAGFLIDLMYVVIGIVSLAFTSYFKSDPATIFNFLTNGQPFGISTPLGVIGLVVIYLNTFILALVLVLFIATGILPFLIGGLTIAVLSPLLAGVAPLLALLGLIIILIVFILLVIHVIRILWMLFKAFANIILLTIFAPFQILAGVLVPSLGFGAWVKSYVANLAVFVVTGVLFLLSWLFLWMSVGAALSSVASSDIIATLLRFAIGGAVTSLLPGAQGTTAWPPLLGIGGGMGTAFVMLGTSLVLFTLIPRAAEVIQGFISGRPFAFGTAIGEAFGPVGTAAVGGANYASSKQQSSYEAYRRGVAAGTIAPNAQTERINAIAGAIRGISGGRVK